MSQDIEVVSLLGGESAALALYTPLDALIAEYRKLRAEIEQITSYVACASDVMTYFCDAARIELKVGQFSAQNLFRAGPAIRSLDARFWSRAMRLTDVLDLMPAEARNEWSRQIKANETPPFEPESVRATLQTMIASRAQFFCGPSGGDFLQPQRPPCNYSAQSRFLPLHPQSRAGNKSPSPGPKQSGEQS